MSSSRETVSSKPIKVNLLDPGLNRIGSELLATNRAFVRRDLLAILRLVGIECPSHTKAVDGDFVSSGLARGRIVEQYCAKVGKNSPNEIAGLNTFVSKAVKLFV